MKKTFLEKMKKTLLLEKEEIIKRNKEADQDIDSHGDETDEIQGAILANVKKSLSSRDSLKLKLINSALNKINDDTYGKCEECEDDIVEKRLEINPYFTLCISCAEQNELESKRKKQ